MASSPIGYELPVLTDIREGREDVRAERVLGDTDELTGSSTARAFQRRINTGSQEDPSVQRQIEINQDENVRYIHGRLEMKRISTDQLKRILNVRDAAKNFAVVVMRNTDMDGGDLHSFLNDLELMLFKIEKCFKK